MKIFKNSEKYQILITYSRWKTKPMSNMLVFFLFTSFQLRYNTIKTSDTDIDTKVYERESEVRSGTDER